MTEIIGKIVTLPKGKIVTVKERFDDFTYLVVDDQGQQDMIIARILRELPETRRRDSLDHEESIVILSQKPTFYPSWWADEGINPPENA